MKPTKEIIFVFMSICVMIACAKTVSTRLQRSTDTCGVSTGTAGLVIRGQSFNRGLFPWIVALKAIEPAKYFCGGTLISSSFVISAAHCIQEKKSGDVLPASNVIALFGAHKLVGDSEPERFALSPTKITIHDDWNPRDEAYDADLSLLEFEEGSILLNRFVQPICLWYSESGPTETTGIVVGWGKSLENDHENEPKFIQVLIQSNEDCLPGQKELAGLASNRTFCAGLKNGSGVCFGDSGGGLFIKINRIHYLKGIVSSSLLNSIDCDVSKNAIYTNVPKFWPWIQKITAPVFKVFCSLTRYLGGSSCYVNQTIDREDYYMESPFNTTVDEFLMQDNPEAKYLPRRIGEKFPNLEFFVVMRCGLTIVRGYYFEKMWSLKCLRLNHNEIASVETNSFADLMNVEILSLEGNMIETLDEKLFSRMTKLRTIGLSRNKIKYLSPTILIIPGSRIIPMVFLGSNVCIDGYYNCWSYFCRKKFDFNQLAVHIKANCTI